MFRFVLFLFGTVSLSAANKTTGIQLLAKTKISKICQNITRRLVPK